MESAERLQFQKEEMVADGNTLTSCMLLWPLDPGKAGFSLR